MLLRKIMIHKKNEINMCLHFKRVESHTRMTVHVQDLRRRRLNHLTDEDPIQLNIQENSVFSYNSRGYAILDVDLYLTQETVSFFDKLNEV